jgi:hypothetical protein
MRLTIFSGPEQRRQSRGSASYTFSIGRAHVRFPGHGPPFREPEEGATRTAAAPALAIVVQAIQGYGRVGHISERPLAGLVVFGCHRFPLKHGKSRVPPTEQNRKHPVPDLFLNGGQHFLILPLVWHT